MNKLEPLIPKIKRNLKKFKKRGVLFVRPGYCTTKGGWLSKEEAIVAVTAAGKKPPKLPSKIEGTPVDVRPATTVEQFSHDKPQQFSQLADHRAEFRGTSLLPEFNPSTESVVAPIAPKVAAAHQTKIPIPYSPASVPLSPVNGAIPMICHVSPDAGWAELQNFISGTKHRLKVSMYDFTSEHILALFEAKLKGKSIQMTLDDPPRNPTADQADPETVQGLKSKLAKKFSSAWALVRSSPEADSWIFPTAYHIKVMVRDSDTVWLSSGNLNNSNQPQIDPVGNPQPDDQKTAKHSDRDWHVIIESPALANTFEAYLDNDFQVAILHAASLTPALKPSKSPTTPPSTLGNFMFAPPQLVTEQVIITPLLTPDPGIYQAAMLNLINSVKHSLYIQLQYIHPSSDPANAKFTDLIDAVGAKINAGVDVKIILSEFQTLKGGLDALQAAGVNLDNVKIQSNVHNKGFVFDHKIVVVSSMNWSGEGVLSNRDAGVIIENATAAQYYEKVFLDDWAHHAAQKTA
ncbi:MAG TPA: phospholipase D-like domain-containing protein [Candidatus Solibacter sp.]|nr:phospholipase D-like domain-containing protein [Candidatus Solibacter sp.]